MRRIVTALVISLTLASHAFAGPLAESGARAVATSEAQQNSKPQMVRKNPGLMWAGIGMWGGGVLMEVLAQTALKTEECVWAADYYSFAYACEEHANRPLMFAGLGLGIAGSVLWWVGDQKVPAGGASLKFGPGSVAVRQSFTF